MLFIRSLLFGSVVLFSSAGFGQTSNTVFGAGYSLPVPINAAPGQILNLFVQGIGAGVTQRVTATSVPLPTVLVGISVQLTQSVAPQSVAVPILAVRPVSTCLNGASIGSGPCGRYTVVTVQIPYELVPNCQPINQACPSTPPLPNPQLVVSENGAAGGAIDLNPVPDQVHVANICDIDTSDSLACAATPLVTHSDGSLVSMMNPAKSGEEIVIYALGLGTTKPAVPTGQVVPSPAPATQAAFEIYPDYQANEAPSRGVPLYLTACATLPICPTFSPVFSGLTPSFVGLYQVNYVIPSPPQGLLHCGGGIASNLTLTIIGSTSLDGAGVCVATSASGIADGSPAAALVPGPSSPTIPLRPFVSNTIWFPTGTVFTDLGHLVQPGSLQLR